MFRKTLPAVAAAFTLALAGAASADQFAVQLERAYGGADARLLETLHVTEIERLSLGDRHFLIVEAPNAAYVEALILATDGEALGLHALDADWSNPIMGRLHPAERIGFLRAIFCDACLS